MVWQFSQSWLRRFISTFSSRRQESLFVVVLSGKRPHDESRLAHRSHLCDGKSSGQTSHRQHLGRSVGLRPLSSGRRITALKGVWLTLPILFFCQFSFGQAVCARAANVILRKGP